MAFILRVTTHRLAVMFYFVLFCARRYCCTVDYILHGLLDVAINDYYVSSVDDMQVRNACFLLGLLDARGDRSSFLSKQELEDIISFVCIM